MADMILDSEKLDEEYSTKIMNLNAENEKPNFQVLKWNLDDDSFNYIRTARNNIDHSINNLQFHSLHFTDFGKNRIKLMKVSPGIY